MDGSNSRYEEIISELEGETIQTNEETNKSSLKKELEK